MKPCPQCNYLLDAFDPVCPRCQGQGVKAPNPATPAAPTKMERLKQEALQTESTSETVGGSLRGGLLALLPAFFITIAFAFHMGMVLSNRDYRGPHSPISFLVSALFFVPLCSVCGAGVGAWLGSSLLVQQTLQWRGSVLLQLLYFAQ